MSVVCVDSLKVKIQFWKSKWFRKQQCRSFVATAWQHFMHFMYEAQCLLFITLTSGVFQCPVPPKLQYKTNARLRVLVFEIQLLLRKMCIGTYERKQHQDQQNCVTKNFTNCVLSSVGRDSSVGIATWYGLDGPRIESRWGRNSLR